MKQILLLFTALIGLFLFGCKKEYDAEATYAKPTIAKTWAKGEPFYFPKAEVYIESSSSWKTFTGFSFTSEGEPDKIGFANPYVAGKGTNALYMQTLYTSQNLTTDSGYYNITIPKCFQLVPKSADSTTVGTVLVIPQTVRIYRKDKTSFDILIAPSDAPGTYNTITGLMEVEIAFDETSIGGGKVKRKYRFNP